MRLAAFRRVPNLTVQLLLSADGLSKGKKINQAVFWPDFLYLAGQLSIFASSCISVVVLLPRNMGIESLPKRTDLDIHPMVPFKRPSAASTDGLFPRQYHELSERLNIDREAFATLAEPSSGAFEMKVSPRMSQQAWGVDPHVFGGEDPNLVPFASVGDPSRRSRLSQLPSLPAVVARIKSPFEPASPVQRAGTTQVLVTTSQMVQMD
jgi:hypothetical protein